MQCYHLPSDTTFLLGMNMIHNIKKLTHFLNICTDLINKSTRDASGVLFPSLKSPFLVQTTALIKPENHLSFSIQEEKPSFLKKQIKFSQQN